MSEGIRRIEAERERQELGEGWTAEHDDKHTNGELADAAISYALDGNRILHWNTSKINAVASIKLHRNVFWPFNDEWWKPEAIPVEGSTMPVGDREWVKDRIRDLTKAGALIAAEIDRLDRILKEPEPKEKNNG